MSDPEENPEGDGLDAVADVSSSGPPSGGGTAPDPAGNADQPVERAVGLLAREIVAAEEEEWGSGSLPPATSGPPDRSPAGSDMYSEAQVAEETRDSAAPGSA